MTKELNTTAGSESFLLDDIVVEVVRSARRKSLSIEVTQQGVKARAPMRMRLSGITSFVTSKEAWIKKHVAALPEPKPDLKLVSGAELLLLGERLELRVMQNQSGKVVLDHDKLNLPVKKSHLAVEDSVKNKLVRWYKHTAQAELDKRVLHFALQMNVPAQKRLSVRVRDYKRRWGSCDHKGELSFNWRIVQAPSAVIDYVVIHELAHCHEFNHSKRFWNIVATHMPDWKTNQTWLSTHGSDLYRI